MNYEAIAMNHYQFKMKFNMHKQATDLIQVQTVSTVVLKPQRNSTIRGIQGEDGKSSFDSR
jgi:hypothetical protein